MYCNGFFKFFNGIIFMDWFFEEINVEGREVKIVSWGVMFVLRVIFV